MENKESLNLKSSKKNNILTVIFVRDLLNKTDLEETLYSISKQTNQIDLAILHSGLSEEDLSTLTEMAKSPKLIVRTKEEDGNVKEEIIPTDGEINFCIVKDEDIDSFPKLFNYGINMAIESEYGYFSIVEPGDIIALNWYKTTAEYFDENKNIDIFLPLIRNSVNGIFNNLMNEAVWVENLVDEAGKADLNLLTRFNCLIPLGAVYKVSSLREYSEKKEDGFLYPFKESMKISHYYEFFMRMVYNDMKIMTIPRIGYEFRTKPVETFYHTSTKIPFNITQLPVENGGVSAEEGQFWVETAKKEYFFDKDKGKTYESKN